MAIHVPTVALVATAALAFGGLAAINIVHAQAHEERQVVISDLRSDLSDLTEKTEAADEAAEDAATAEVEVRVLISGQDDEFATTDGFLE